MRWLGRLFALMVVVALAIVLYPGERSSEPRTVRDPTIGSRDFTFTLRQGQPLAFRADTDSVRIISNALSSETDPAIDGGHYTLQVQWLADGEVIFSERQSHSVADAATLRARYAGRDQIERASPSQVAVMQVPENASSFRLSVTRDSPIGHVALRVFARREESVTNVTRDWIRLSQSQRRELAEASVYPHELLTPLQRRELLSQRWEPVAPRGIEGEDFERVFVYRLEDRPRGPAFAAPEDDAAPEHALVVPVGVYRAFEWPGGGLRMSHRCAGISLEWVVLGDEGLQRGMQRPEQGRVIDLPEGERLWLRASEPCEVWLAADSAPANGGSALVPVEFRTEYRELIASVAFEVQARASRAALRLEMVCRERVPGSGIEVSVRDMTDKRIAWSGNWPPETQPSGFARLGGDADVHRLRPRYLVLPEGQYRIAVNAPQVGCFVAAATRPLRLVWNQADDALLWFPLSPVSGGRTTSWLVRSPSFEQAEMDGPAQDGVETAWRALDRPAACCDHLFFQALKPDDEAASSDFRVIERGRSYARLHPDAPIRLYYQQAPGQARTLSWSTEERGVERQHALSGEFGRLWLETPTEGESVAFFWRGEGLRLFADNLSDGHGPPLGLRYAQRLDDGPLAYGVDKHAGEMLILARVFEPSGSGSAVLRFSFDDEQTHPDWRWTDTWTIPHRSVRAVTTDGSAYAWSDSASTYRFSNYGLRMAEDVAPGHYRLEVEAEEAPGEAHIRLSQPTSANDAPAPESEAFGETP